MYLVMMFPVLLFLKLFQQTQIYVPSS